MTISIALAAALIASGSTTAGCQADSYTKLLADFPDAVRYDRFKATIEYCPDNTCHRFASRNKASCEAMSDFLLLYLRYFSDYTYLEEWRAHQDTNLRVAEVMSKSPYLACTRDRAVAPARCAIEKARATYRIVGYNVTYDEGKAIKITMSFKSLKQAAQ
jgi:transglutaminase-like putative cysteine protease